MKKKTVIIISCLAILMIVFAYIIFNIIMSRPASSTMLSISPQTISGTAGQDFTINVSVSKVTDLYGWQLKLRWNTTILDVVNAAEGTFLKSRGNTFFHQIINETGYIVLDCTLLGDVLGVNGSGVLATIQFHVKESGNCDLDFYDTVLINSLEQPITHTVKDGHVST